MTISQATKFLEDAFDALNQEYFESTLSRPIITIQTDPKAYGRYTPSQWRDTRKGKGFDEINLGAETLDRPIANVVATLIHEMVHQYCELNGIQDTSRGNTYHNSRFKAEAEKRGLIIDYNEKIGYSITTPSPALKSFCTAQHWRNKLTLVRSGGLGGKEPAPKKPSSTRKYTCPCCGASVRATKEVHILCTDCDQEMVTDTTPDTERKAS